MKTPFQVPLSIGALFLFPAISTAQDHPAKADEQATAGWSQWRGPHRTGEFVGPTWPRRLNATNCVSRWRVELGRSYSGPVVDAERVYVTETVDRKYEVVRALDRKTGKEVWKNKWKGSMTVPFFAAKNGSWIRSTPSLYDGQLFVGGIRDVLVCINAESGKTEWSMDFTEEFGTPIESFGFVCSPVAHGEHVYVQCGAGLVKLNRKDGSVAWHSLKERGGMFGGAFSSPIFAEIHGKEQLLVQTRTTLTGVAPEDGSVLWKMPVKSFRGMNILTPLPYKNGIFTSAYGGRAHFFEISKHEEEEDAMSVSQKWTNRAQANMTSPVRLGQHAFLYLRSKRFCCVDLDAGKVNWISKPIDDTYWSIVSQGDRMLALGDGGDLYLLGANPKEYELVDRLPVADSSSWAHLAMDGREIFVRDLEGLSVFRWETVPSK